MAKSPTPSPERQALAQAHEAARAAEQALSVAKDAQSQALSTLAEAGRDIDGLERRVAGLLDRRDPGANELRWDYAREVDAARAALQAAEQRIEPFRIAYHATRSAISEAECAITDAQARIAAAAGSVAAAEALPIAREHLARCREALATLLEHAPHLLVMVDKNLLPADLTSEITNMAGSSLMKLRDWAEIDQRYRTSPWRAAKQMLERDPQAVLPQAAP
jgi:hypothetical protein